MHDGRGCLLAAPDARGSHHTHIGAAQQGRQARKQVLRAGEFTAEAVTHTHREAGRSRITAHDLEVVVETGDLVDLGHGNLHLTGQRHQVAVMQARPGVVDLVQVFDQQVAAVAPGRRRTDEGTHLVTRTIVDLAALEPALAADALAHGVDRHSGNNGRLGGKSG